jgi:tetratricopeptide (TPR) repeat protein
MGWGGMGWGYPYWGTGFGWGYFGWPGLLTRMFGYGGYGGNGYGYGGGYGSGYGTYAYDPYCVASVSNYGTPLAGPATTTPQENPDQNAVAKADPPAKPKTATDAAENARVFAEKGENDFRTGDYKAAAYSWKHAVVDDPQNGVLTMMIAQALFATGEFADAAGATQVAMRLLPKDQWGVVVKNYRELYGKTQDYTNQLRVLEKAVKDKPDDPALRFLAGFHYAYLGYPKEAVDQLDKGLKLAPRDEMTKKLRDEMQAKLPKSATPPPPAPAAENNPKSPQNKATAQQ